MKILNLLVASLLLLVACNNASQEKEIQNPIL